MKNYININEIPELASVKEQLIEAAVKDLSYYFANLPDEQKIKYDKIQAADFIKMYSVPIKYDEEVDCPCSGNKIELFNFTADGPEQSYNNGSGPQVSDIDNLIGDPVSHYNLPFFSNVLMLIPEKLRAAWIFFYKKGATVIEDEGHGHDTILLHLLLEDIDNGEFVTIIKNEARQFTKKGDYFIFDGIVPHRAYFTGDTAAFLVFAANNKDIIKD